jgi:hypothetical protein
MPKFSVLIPSRGRAAFLMDCVDNILTRAKHPDDVEVLVRFDDDDPTVNEVQLPTQVRQIVGARPDGGYVNIHLLYNELAQVATGQYFIIFNDDARFKTDGWDVRLWDGLDNKMVVAHTGRHGSLFPIVHRGFFDATGHLSPAFDIDIWFEFWHAHPTFGRTIHDVWITHEGGAPNNRIFGIGPTNSARNMHAQLGVDIQTVMAYAQTPQ